LKGFESDVCSEMLPDLIDLIFGSGSTDCVDKGCFRVAQRELSQFQTVPR
jgi:hypothetical protein